MDPEGQKHTDPMDPDPNTGSKWLDVSFLLIGVSSVLGMGLERQDANPGPSQALICWANPQPPVC